MEIMKLYRYEREGGGTTVSPVRPDGEHTEMHRLVAEAGKVLTNGEVMTSCVDVPNIEGWTEIDDLDEEENI